MAGDTLATLRGTRSVGAGGGVLSEAAGGGELGEVG